MSFLKQIPKAESRINPSFNYKTMMRFKNNFNFKIKNIQFKVKKHNVIKQMKFILKLIRNNINY